MKRLFALLCVLVLASASAHAREGFGFSKKAAFITRTIPPALNTDLGGKGLHDEGVPLAEFADAMIEGLKRGEREIGFGFSEKARNASRAELDAISARMDQR